MTFEEVAVRIGLPEIEEPFTRGWEESERAYPDAGLPFLDERFIAENGALVSLDRAAIEALADAAKRVRNDAALSHLLWHEHRLFRGLGPVVPLSRGPRTFHRSRVPETVSARRPRVPFLDDEHVPSGFPELADTAVEDAPALNLLVALSAVPDAVSFYERRRIPSTVLRETLSDFAIWVCFYREHLGYTGINIGTLSWLRFHLRGRLFRLGRLQFKRGSFTRDLTVYRSTKTSRVTALAAEGLTVGSDGLLLFGPDEANAGEAVWTTMRHVDAAAVCGNPVAPTGTVLREEVVLPFDEYLPVLHERTPILEMHIPEGDPMSLSGCADSLARAAGFFHEHFPERAFAAFTCESWFLGRELLDLLAAGANMRSFANELYLYPCMGTDEDAIPRLFGPLASRTSPDRWPRTTSLQRAAAVHLEAGGKLRPGGGFLLADDLPWGRSVYRAL